ncbi:ATP-binding protein [Streptomyces sp. NPDC056194]|uniref:ATP-binding protein n=1 Tax=unclassified Streptomyces TaxID=2593676 RepID=UPI0035D71DE9
MATSSMFPLAVVGGELLADAIAQGCGAGIALPSWCGSSLRSGMAATDESGWGLFLVARLAQRWGTTYTDRGKVIWCVRLLTAKVEQLFEAMLM